MMDLGNQLGTKMEGAHSSSNTQAITDAAIGVGRIRAAFANKGVRASAFYDIP
jgi:hypothetical protein